MKKITMSLCAIALLAGCAETYELDKEQSEHYITAELADKDFEKAAKLMLDDALSNELSGNKKYIMEVAEVKNDTMQKINTAELTDYMRKVLRRGGRVQLTNIGENASVLGSRELAKNAAIDKSTAMKSGKVVAPNTSLFGRIAQRDFIVGGKKKIEYTFSLAITDLNTGLEIWSSKEVITKLTSKDKKTW
ncbi:MAG: penicillin-binding protein activator LpoB [Rickettsiales bacterium]|jgi:uncharacterized protein (TIGR02722 family)|nr:penicillin-binding protein activator LpoB [Rickettsiales bacterium]